MPKLAQHTRSFKARYATECVFTGTPIPKDTYMRLYTLEDGRSLPVSEAAHEVLNPQRPSEEQPYYTLAARVEDATALTLLTWLRENPGRSLTVFWRGGQSRVWSLIDGKIYSNTAERGITLKSWEAVLNDPQRGGVWAWRKNLPSEGRS